ncbi:MAG: EpsG family protein [Ruminococcaceae bacterium]|nr:EpsG family protein [Oscillospiraceae bacterium]
MFIPRSIIELFCLVGIVTMLGFIYNNILRSYEPILMSEGHDALKRKVSIQLDLIIYAITIILSLYCGLRTSFNDTWIYMSNFINLDTSLSSVDLSISENPGFTLLQIFIKRFISDNPQWLILICATITIYLNIQFIKEYSINVGASVFLYMTSCVYMFGFAAVKQTLATALMMIAFTFAVEKKWIRFYMIFVVAVSIHAYAFVFVVTPFFVRSAWGKWSYTVLFGSVTIGVLFNSFIGVFLKILGAINDSYSADLLVGDGVSLYRVVVFFVPVGLSWLCRSYVKKQNDRMLNLCCNFSLIGFAFMFIALFGNPVLFGRMGNYFLPFSLVTVCYMVFRCTKKTNRYVMVLIMGAAYLVYFYTYFKIYIDAGWDDFFHHASIMDLFK